MLHCVLGLHHLYDHPHLFHSRDHRRHDGPGHLSSHGLDRPGFENDHDRAYHNHAHDDHLYVESSLHVRDAEEWANVPDEANGLDDLQMKLVHDHGQNQSATRQTEEYVPTKEAVSYMPADTTIASGTVPQSLARHLSPAACYASHDKHHRHHGDSHTRQRQTYLSC